MSERSRWHGRFLNRILLFALVPTALLAALVAVPLPARAGPCDQVGGVITGDWTISNVQVCSGILYTVDGSVTVNAGGSLTLINGGLRFAKDAYHQGYSLTVLGGGEFILDNSVVTTATDAINPFLKLAFTVSGANSHFAMRNGAVLRFPGWLNATGATIDMTDSTITGFMAPDLVGLGLYPDDNDDSPVLNWASTTASLYGSRIERIYENTSAASDPNATGIIAANVWLQAGSNLYTYDSYIGVDFSNIRGLHNELRVDGTSNAYLYGGTIDLTEDPASKTDWRPAYVPTAGGGSVYLLRWLRITAVDSTVFPVSGTSIVSTLSPSATLAQYPDNGFANTPSARTLAYLGRAASGGNAWDVTNANGLAVIPLYTDQITTTTLPNAESFGNYHMALTYISPPPTSQTFSASGGVNFDAYPAIASEDNSKAVWVPFPSLTVRTEPDLLLKQADYVGALSVIQGQSFSVTVLIYNQGQTAANGTVSIAAYLNGNLLAPPVARADGLTVATFLSQSILVDPITGLGTQTLMLFVDPDRMIVEGGAAQEANNFANITLSVQTPPNGAVYIVTPNQGQAIDPEAALKVTGYLRDENNTGIVGIPLAITLRTGATVVTSNLTASGLDGYFEGTLNIPPSTADGSYTLLVTPTSGSMASDTRGITLKRSVSFLNGSIFGLPLWIWLIVIVGAAAAIGGGTAYVKFVGLGKLVECGECGSYIPGDSAKCPKCGVEFEKGMAKCSNCQTWIPVAVKQCPECGVEFATGEVEMADYQAQMRSQYEDVRRKFREEAARDIGRPLTDREFGDWWRTQPSFVTFEDWLREEEDMRRMGSKPCPACQTLNSVTATVCHKCGTLLKEDTRRARPPSGARPLTRTAGQPMPPPPAEPIPAKTVKKAVAGPVVQKKVIPGEGQTSESSGGTANTAAESQPEDDI